MLAPATRRAYAIFMLDRPVKRIVGLPLEEAGALLARGGVRANTVSFVGLGAGALTAISVMLGWYWIGVAFLTLGRIADGLDGAVARQTRESALGAILDISLDLIAYGLVAFAFALIHPGNGLAATFLLLGLIVATVTGLAARTSEGSNFIDSDEPRGLLICEQTETFLVFLLMFIAPWSFAVLCYVYGGLCFVSAALFVASGMRGNRPSSTL